MGRKSTWRRASRKYYYLNKEKILARQNEYRKKRLIEDPIFKLRTNMSIKFSQWMRGQRKTCSVMESVGCSIRALWNHLENQFQEGMTRDNYGQWHIDHVIPLKYFDPTNGDDMNKAWHYTNLQPLWAEQNLRKAARMEA